MQAVLAILMLRGAQTVGEIRARCERMHAFGSPADVEEILERSATRAWRFSCPRPPAPRKPATPT
jgi:uncharacterized protein YceH (UPF0502 family)